MIKILTGGQEGEDGVDVIYILCRIGLYKDGFHEYSYIQDLKKKKWRENRCSLSKLSQQQPISALFSIKFLGGSFGVPKST